MSELTAPPAKKPLPVMELDSTLVQQYRFPRSKKRRIRLKWRKREENYRPIMVPFQSVLMLGAGAAEMLGIDESTRLTANTPIYFCHPSLWEMACKEPGVRESFDVRDAIYPHCPLLPFERRGKFRG